MDNLLKVALIQTSARPDMQENLTFIDQHIERAVKQGVKFVLTPENSCHMLHPQTAKLDVAVSEDEHPFLKHFLKRAEQLDIWLLLGSITIKDSDGKLLNRSYLISPKGEIVARYDKIHLFDVDTPDGVSYRESLTFNGGDKAVMAQSEIGNIGLTICYDVRFPHLYRDLAQLGADIITVPAAFTVPTGHAHWEVLLRARAIENGVFILAPAQTGTHQGERTTWGHSLVINPWGEILADGGSEPGVIITEIDLSEVGKRRGQIPSLKNGRPYSVFESSKA
jgi:predicted amidohydrolase